LREKGRRRACGISNVICHEVCGWPVVGNFKRNETRSGQSFAQDNKTEKLTGIKQMS